MTQKYFELLTLCKQISPEAKERIEELKFWCFVNTDEWDEFVRVTRVNNCWVDIEWKENVNECQLEILWSFSIIDLMDLLWKQYFYSDGLIYFYENYFWDISLHDRIKLEPWKEHHEQSEKTLQKCINLVK